MRIIIVLVVGLACGYYLGYEDGIAGKPSIVNRVVGRAGGSARSGVSNDIDAQMRQAEDSTKAPVKPAPR
jgi:hypothetical protein